MQICPKCQSKEIYRSRVRTNWEAWRKQVTNKRLYRCHICGWRGWGIVTRPRHDEADGTMAETAAAALTPEPPNLHWTELAWSDAPQDVDLDVLDSRVTVSDKRS